jgi:hypothetical protein
MLLVDCFVLELCVIRYVLMSFIYKVVVLVMFCIHSIFFMLVLFHLICFEYLSLYFFVLFSVIGFVQPDLYFFVQFPVIALVYPDFDFFCTVPFSIIHSASTLQEHLTSSPVCSGVRVAQCLVNFQCTV